MQRRAFAERVSGAGEEGIAHDVEIFVFNGPEQLGSNKPKF